MTPADLDADIPEIFRDLPRWEYFGQCSGHSLGRGNAQTAGIGAGTSNDVLDELGARIAQIVGNEFVIKFFQTPFGNPSDHHVLVDRRADVAIRVPLR